MIRVRKCIRIVNAIGRYLQTRQANSCSARSSGGNTRDSRRVVINGRSYSASEAAGEIKAPPKRPTIHHNTRASRGGPTRRINSLDGDLRIDEEDPSIQAITITASITQHHLNLVFSREKSRSDAARAIQRDPIPINCHRG